MYSLSVIRTFGGMEAEWLAPAQFLLDNIPDAVISTDLHFHIRSWNKGAESLYGQSAAEVLGRPIDSVVVHEFLTDSREIAWEKLRTEGRWKGEFRMLNKAGRQFFLESSSSCIRDIKGQILGYIAVNRDITEIRQVKEQIFNTERVFRSFMENTPTLTWILDENACFRYMNSSYMKKFGLSETAIGRSIY